MDSLFSAISTLMTFFKLLLSFLSMLGVTDEEEGEALNKMFDEIGEAVGAETEANAE